MSKSKGEVLKEKFQRIIDRCEEAGNKNAAAVYKKVLSKKLDELQKKSLKEVPGLQEQAVGQREQVKGMLKGVDSIQEELSLLNEKLIAGREKVKTEIEEKIKNLNENELKLHEIIGETVGTYALIQEITLALLDDSKDKD